MPPNVKQARERSVLLGHFDVIGRRALISVGFIWVAILSVYVVTYQENKLVENQLQVAVGANISIENQVREINQLVNVVGARVEEHPAWTPLVKDVVASLPQEARLEMLVVRVEQDALLIEGSSTSRTAVLDMQANLEALSWVVRLEAPLQNFAAGPRNAFSFKLWRSETYEDNIN